jgi:tetratricopeptide (TPR) repeat protein
VVKNGREVQRDSSQRLSAVTFPQAEGERSNEILALFNGVAYREKNDYDRAIADYTQAIRLDPNDADAYLNRGVTYANKKDYAHARANWEKVLQLKPNDANARKNLEVLRNQGH